MQWCWICCCRGCGYMKVLCNITEAYSSFPFLLLYQSHIQVMWHSTALEYVLFIQREVKIMLHSGRHALIWDETDIFLSQDSSKLKKKNTYNHTCDHLIVLQSSKVILKHESQLKIMNQHGIIDYGNVILLPHQINGHKIDWKRADLAKWQTKTNIL